MLFFLEHILWHAQDGTNLAQVVWAGMWEPARWLCLFLVEELGELAVEGQENSTWCCGCRRADGMTNSATTQVQRKGCELAQPQHLPHLSTFSIQEGASLAVPKLQDVPDRMKTGYTRGSSDVQWGSSINSVLKLQSSNQTNDSLQPTFPRKICMDKLVYYRYTVT